MKAIINNTDLSNHHLIEKVYFEDQEAKNNVEVIDYYEDQVKGQLFMSLYSTLFSENQQKIYIRENKLIIIVSETIHSLSKTTYVSDWQNYT